jgi:DNA polymerase-3 subunit delta
VAALAAYCKSRDYDLSRRKGAEEHRLGAFLDEAPPEWSFLLITAAQVDRRTRLFKRFDESGAVLFLGVERDKSGRLSRESLVDFVGRRIAQSGKNIEPQARESIVARAGEDLRELRQEIDKLLLFVGEEPTIRVTDVAAVMIDHGEGWVFDLTRAVGERNAALALAELARLMAQGEPALKILGAIAAESRRLLAARYLQTAELARLWKRGMSYQQFQQTVLRQGAPLLTRNPYADYMCFQRAELFSLAELRAHMERLFDADYRLKSSGAQPRLVLERLILAMCRRPRKAPGRGQAAAPV